MYDLQYISRSRFITCTYSKGYTPDLALYILETFVNGMNLKTVTLNSF
jgi:hypothetical protein